MAAGAGNRGTWTRGSPGTRQPDAEASSAEPAGPRQWWERTRGLEPGGREIPETRQADAQEAGQSAGRARKRQQWFERARDGLDPARGEAQPDRYATPSADPRRCPPLQTPSAAQRPPDEVRAGA